MRVFSLWGNNGKFPSEILAHDTSFIFSNMETAILDLKRDSYDLHIVAPQLYFTQEGVERAAHIETRLDQLSQILRRGEIREARQERVALLRELEGLVCDNTGIVLLPLIKGPTIYMQSAEEAQ
jgi:hypothetical protein